MNHSLKRKKAESSIIAVFRYRVQTLIHQSDISSQIHGWLAKFAERTQSFRPATNFDKRTQIDKETHMLRVFFNEFPIFFSSRWR